ncbi:MAG: penicillin acylase family protein [Chloroflexi bacterium]|nr:penicillin acylase family protein [Chloroflexota bacterium]
MPAIAQLRSLSGLAAGAVRALAIAKSGRAHPQVSGRLRVPGLDERITVTRDRFGIPHVEARSDTGAVFGQGFAQAHDRLFQLELFRRGASGRLAEVFGPRALDADRFSRRLGLTTLSRNDLDATSAEARGLLEAFADGVNAAVATLPALPPEFAITGTDPEPWRPEHSLLIGRLLLLGFSPNWDAELQRDRLVAALGPERAALVDVTYPPDAPTGTGEPYSGTAERLLRAYDAIEAAGVPAGGASNAWALAGSRTRSGAPLLACDPHVRAGVPSLFHVAHIRGGDLDVIGASVPGVPGVVIGHNRDVAWGMTAGLADVSDCYIEEFDPQQPARYRTPDGWERARSRVERIHVRGGEPIEEVMVETRHGPVVGPALPDESRAIVLRSTAIEPGETVGPLLDANRARDVAGFDAAIARWPGATFNFVFADRAGAIGYRLAGSIPRRAEGQGLVPQDGATSPGPPEPLPADEMPHLIDPPDGTIVSANQAPGGPLELGEEWMESHRAERIAELLAVRDDHTVASCQAVQSDLHSAPLVALRDLVLARDIASDEVRGALAAWDGQVRADSAAAAVMETVYQEAARTLVTRVAGTMSELVLGRGLGGPAGEDSRFHYRLQSRIVAALAAAQPPWCDGEDDRDRVLRAALERSLGELRERIGARPAEWRWGALRSSRQPHPLGGVPGLGRAFAVGPNEMPGDVNTIWQGGYSVHHGPDASGGFSPGYRQVVDLADWDRSTFQLPAGNSGIPGHPHYGDSASEFFEGRQRPMLYSRDAIAANAEGTLVLEPNGERP